MKLITRLMRFAVARRAPVLPHLELSGRELAPHLEAALQASPAAAAWLSTAPAPEALLAVHVVAGIALRIPVRLRAGQEDHALLLGILRGREYSPRHAARCWASLTSEGRAVRLEQFDRSRSTAKHSPGQYAWPWRRRKDGTPCPSSTKTYTRRKVKSVSYVTSEALVDQLEVPELEQLGRELSRRIPRPWRVARWAALRSHGPAVRGLSFRVLARCCSRDELRQAVRTSSIRAAYGAIMSNRVISSTHRSAVKNRKDGLRPASSGREAARGRGGQAPPGAGSNPRHCWAGKNRGLDGPGRGPARPAGATNAPPPTRDPSVDLARVAALLASLER